MKSKEKDLIFWGVTVGLTVSFMILGVFMYRTSWLRLWESVRDLGASCQYYFGQLFQIGKISEITVLLPSEVIDITTGLPKTGETFSYKLKAYFRLLLEGRHLSTFGEIFAEKMMTFLQVIIILIPVGVALFFIIKRIYKRVNNRYGKDTIFLKVFKKVTGVIYSPIRAWVGSYVDFLRNKRWIGVTWITIWATNFNITPIIISFFAYYLYFVISFDLISLYGQFCKLIIDFKMVLLYLPVWLEVIIFWKIFDGMRKGIGLGLLRYFEARNCGFIKELPIVSMSCGSMGKKKTTMITDMALSQEVMFRQEAFSRLQKQDLKFPFFPWVSFENEIKVCMEYGVIYNLASIRAWVALKRQRYEKHNDADKQLYGYDTKRYGTDYDDGLKEENLFDVLETYAKLYFIYVIQSSLIVSNYSIRTDNVQLSEGNFPLWSYDFFTNGVSADSRFAHILDFDVLRLGKKVLKNNPKRGSFEFGVVVISEVGKERGNNLELTEVKKTVQTANQKNDLFNSWLKLCRHSATVDNFPFIKVFTDEQRPESWGADARDLCDIVTIVKSGERKMALPFYTIEETIAEWCFDKFMDLYYDLRYYRGDNTLLVYLLKRIVSAIYQRHVKLYNRFGFSVLTISTERGTMDGKKAKKKYFLMNKKIYSDRFSTDCFSDYFNDMAKKSKTGITDYLEYASSKATVLELKEQNSYFINALYKDVGE